MQIKLNFITTQKKKKEMSSRQKSYALKKIFFQKPFVYSLWSGILINHFGLLCLSPRQELINQLTEQT